jgi:uncharacterized protein (TIGR00304 family)
MTVRLHYVTSRLAIRGKPISRFRTVKPEAELADNLLFNIGLLLALAGFAIAILAIFAAILRSARGKGQVRGGGVVMIGPVPIVFGTDKESARILILLGIVLTVVLLLLTLLQVAWR